MRTLEQKIKSINKIIKIKKNTYDKELMLISRIKSDKKVCQENLKKSQLEYMDGVNKLNELRTSNNRENLHVFELGLDKLNASWIDLNKDLKEIDNKEFLQTAVINKAYVELKKIEKLVEKYEDEYQKVLIKNEQNMQDELSLVKYRVKK